MTTYKLLVGNRGTKDCERAILPTVLWASKKSSENDCTISVRALSIGWWAWGIGVMQTKVESDLF